MARLPWLAFALALPAAALAQAAGPFPAAPGFEFRYGVLPGSDLASLVDRPALVSMKAEILVDPASGERRLSGEGESHSVFDLPLAAMAAVIEDMGSQAAWAPRVRESRIESRSGAAQIVVQDIGISFLGFHTGYRTRAELVRDELPGGAVGLRARLLESLDGNLAASVSSWYLEEVRVGGKRMTYLRILSKPLVRRPFAGMVDIVRIFTPGELAGMQRAIAAETRRRLGLR